MSWKRVLRLSEAFLVCSMWFGGLSLIPRPSQAQGTMPMPPKTEGGMKSKAKMPASAKMSDAEIQQAKASGKVWVNTSTGVYHKSGKWYGNTKQGQFMSEQDAMKAGYRPAKNEGSK
jgi:hypothetical protein